MRKYLFGATILMLVAAGCKQDKNLTKATISDTGDIASEGCGYILILEDGTTKLRPRNLPSNYQHNGLKVKVKYDESGDGERCRINNDYFFLEVVDLTVIKRDLD